MKNKVTNTNKLKEYWGKNKIAIVGAIIVIFIIGAEVLKKNNLIDLNIFSKKEIEKKAPTDEEIKKESKEFSLDELLEILYFDHDRFDSYVLKKGYYFDNSEITKVTDDAMVYTYLSKDNNTRPLEPLDFRLITFSDFIHEDHWALSHCTYKTSENREYIEFKRQLKENGFVYFGSRGYESSICLIYKKGKVDFLLETNNIEINGETKNIYQMELILHRNSDIE